MLYYLGGENIYQSQLRLQELRNEFSQEQSGTVTILHADEMESANDLLKNAESLGLFTNTRLNIVKYLSAAPKSYEETIVTFLEKKQEVNFIFWEPRTLDKRKKLYKLLKQKGVIEEFAPLSHNQLRSWIQQILRGRLEADTRSIDQLLLKVGNDQLQLASLLDNLFILVKSEGRDRLLPEDIDRFVTKTVEESIWELVDAISVNDKKTALLIIEQMLRERSDFMLIISMIGRQLRILFLTKKLLDQGYSQAEIIRTLKLHPFVARKAVIQSQNFSIDQLKKLYQKLVNTDLAIKESRFEEKLALDLFISAL
jgi:DNA polymerase-3 subunit delta